MKHVFIVGPPRSGTTLLQAMFQRFAGKSLVTMPETHFFDILLPQLLAAGNEEKKQEVMARYATTFHGERFRESLGRAVAGVGVSDDHRALFETIALTLSGKNASSLAQANHLLEKTPDHLFHIGNLLALDSDARVIILFRHPAPAIASECEQSRHWPAGYQPPSFWIGRWRESVRVWLQWRADPRIRTVFYERLLTAPREGLGALLSWCGIEWCESANESQLQFTLPKEEWKQEEASRGWPNRQVDRRVPPFWLSLAVYAELREEMKTIGYGISRGSFLGMIARTGKPQWFTSLANRQMRRMWRIV